MWDSITSKTLLYFQKNRTDSKTNRNNGAISAEDFITGLYNILYEKDNPEYIPTKKLKVNYPGIDVLSTKKKQGIQVTVQKDLSKIKNTFTSIPPFSENKDFSEVLFVIQDTDLPNNLKKFAPSYEGYSLKILSAAEIFREIDNADDEQMKKICAYVEGSIVMPEDVISNRNVDAEVFKMLFNSLNLSLRNNSSESNIENEELVYITSPAEKMKKYNDEWTALVQIYKASIGLKDDGSEIERFISYHKYVEEAFSQDLNEVDKSVIQGYLRTKSTILLHANNNDPVNAINQMALQMRNELGLGFVPSSHVLSFLLNMFFKCDVFPLIKI